MLSSISYSFFSFSFSHFSSSTSPFSFYSLSTSIFSIFLLLLSYLGFLLILSLSCFSVQPFVLLLFSVRLDFSSPSPLQSHTLLLCNFFHSLDVLLAHTFNKRAQPRFPFNLVRVWKLLLSILLFIFNTHYLSPLFQVIKGPCMLDLKTV